MLCYRNVIEKRCYSHKQTPSSLEKMFFFTASQAGSNYIRKQLCKGYYLNVCYSKRYSHLILLSSYVPVKRFKVVLAKRGRERGIWLRSGLQLRLSQR